MPFALGYAMPFAFGVEPSLPMELSAVPLGFIPLAFASAIVRYRLMDVEIILKRLLVYTSAVGRERRHLRRSSSAPPAARSSRAKTDQRWVIAFLATIVVLLLARPVKDGVQRAIDRAFYRDRYDYRRALVGFARDLNTDLDLDRLAERLVTRVGETIELDAMAFHVGVRATATSSRCTSPGSSAACPACRSTSRHRRTRRPSGQIRCASTIRWPSTRFTAEEVEFWRDTGHLLLRALRLEGRRRSRCWCSAAARAASR